MILCGKYISLNCRGANSWRGGGGDLRDPGPRPRLPHTDRSGRRVGADYQSAARELIFSQTIEVLPIIVKWRFQLRVRPVIRLSDIWLTNNQSAARELIFSQIIGFANHSKVEVST